jgi:hypothetical protein
MTSAQLGTAQLGLAQLGAYTMLDTPASTPPVTPVGTIIDSTKLSYVVIPDYFRMMGIKVE